MDEKFMEGLWKVGAKPISQDMLFEAAYNPSSFTFCYQLTPTLTRTKVWLLGICWIIGFGCTPSDGGLRQPSLEATRTDLRSPVDTAIVQPRAIIQTVQAQGEVFFARQVGLSFEVEGWLISDQKKDGTRVRAGERLATLDTLRIAYQLRQARLALAQAELERSSQRILYGVEQLPDSSHQDSLRLRADNIDLRTGYASAVAEVAYLSQLAERHHLVAPFDGQVIDMTYQRGAYVPRGGEVLRLIDMGSASIRVALTEQELTQVSLGKRAEIHIPAIEADLVGRIRAIRPVLDEQGLARVEIGLSRSTSNLMEGMFAEVRIEASHSSERLAIPVDALLQRQGDPFVFVWQAPGRAAWRTVVPGRRNQQWVEVKQGLQAGEPVLIRGHEHLSHQAPILIQGPN